MKQLFWCLFILALMAFNQSFGQRTVINHKINAMSSRLTLQGTIEETTDKLIQLGELYIIVHHPDVQRVIMLSEYRIGKRDIPDFIIGPITIKEQTFLAPNASSIKPIAGKDRDNATAKLVENSSLIEGYFGPALSLSDIYYPNDSTAVIKVGKICLTKQAVISVRIVGASIKTKILKDDSQFFEIEEVWSDKVASEFSLKTTVNLDEIAPIDASLTKKSQPLRVKSKIQDNSTVAEQKTERKSSLKPDINSSRTDYTIDDQLIVSELNYIPLKLRTDSTKVTLENMKEEKTNEIANLKDGVSKLQEKLKLTPSDDPKRPYTKNELKNAEAELKAAEKVTAERKYHLKEEADKFLFTRDFISSPRMTLGLYQNTKQYLKQNGLSNAGASDISSVELVINKVKIQEENQNWTDVAPSKEIGYKDPIAKIQTKIPVFTIPHLERTAAINLYVTLQIVSSKIPQQKTLILSLLPQKQKVIVQTNYNSVTINPNTSVVGLKAQIVNYIKTGQLLPELDDIKPKNN